MSDDLVTAEHLIRGLRENLGTSTLGPHLGVLLAEYDRRGAEIDRLHSWAGLIELLDEQYPADVFSGTSTDPGPTIIVLTRQLNDMRAERDEALGLLRELLDAAASWSSIGNLLGRIRALVERVGPAGAHPAESED